MQFEIERLSQKELFKPKDFSLLKSIFCPLINRIKKNYPKIVIVAGTNGKGETSRFISSICFKKNKFNNVALWTSPHVLSFNERFNFNGKDLSDLDIQESLDTYLELFPENSCALSFYELSFWIFCHQAMKRQSDLLVLEVGLGGRLDAVNLFDADISVLTSISRDHTEYLGSTYKKILKEKLGVVRRNSNFIFSTRTNYLTKLVKDFAMEIKVKDLIYVSPCTMENVNYHQRNFNMAVHVAEKLGINLSSDETYQNFLPFGFGKEVSFEGKKISFSNAHNIDGHREFLNDLNSSCSKNVILFFSKRPNKEIQQIFKMYKNKFGNKLSIAGIDNHYKILPLNKLKDIGIGGCEFFDFTDPKIVWRELSIFENDLLMVGSNFIRGHICRHL